MTAAKKKSLAPAKPTTASTPARRKPGRPQGARMRGSFTDQMEALEIGETIARASRMSPEECSPAHQVELQKKMNGIFSSAIYRANRDKGFEYSQARGQFWTDDGYVMLVMTATRVK